MNLRLSVYFLIISTFLAPNLQAGFCSQLWGVESEASKGLWQDYLHLGQQRLDKNNSDSTVINDHQFILQSLFQWQNKVSSLKENLAEKQKVFVPDWQWTERSLFKTYNLYQSYLSKEEVSLIQIREDLESIFYREKGFFRGFSPGLPTNKSVFPKAMEALLVDLWALDIARSLREKSIAVSLPTKARSYFSVAFKNLSSVGMNLLSLSELGFIVDFFDYKSHDLYTEEAKQTRAEDYIQGEWKSKLWEKRLEITRHSIRIAAAILMSGNLLLHSFPPELFYKDSYELKAEVLQIYERKEGYKEADPLKKQELKLKLDLMSKEELLDYLLEIRESDDQ